MTAKPILIGSQMYPDRSRVQVQVAVDSADRGYVVTELRWSCQRGGRADGVSDWLLTTESLGGIKHSLTDVAKEIERRFAARPNECDTPWQWSCDGAPL